MAALKNRSRVRPQYLFRAEAARTRLTVSRLKCTLSLHHWRVLRDASRVAARALSKHQVTRETRLATLTRGARKRKLAEWHKLTTHRTKVVLVETVPIADRAQSAKLLRAINARRALRAAARTVAQLNTVLKADRAAPKHDGARRRRRHGAARVLVLALALWQPGGGVDGDNNLLHPPERAHGR